MEENSDIRSTDKEISDQINRKVFHWGFPPRMFFIVMIINAVIIGLSYLILGPVSIIIMSVSVFFTRRLSRYFLKLQKLGFDSPGEYLLGTFGTPKRLKHSVNYREIYESKRSK